MWSMFYIKGWHYYTAGDCTVQLISKVMFERVWNACRTRLRHMQDTSTSTRPCYKAAARHTWVPRPFFKRWGCIQNACGTCPECLWDVSETRANVTLELSCTVLLNVAVDKQIQILSINRAYINWHHGITL